MRAATLESRLEELGVLRSFSRPRVSNDNPYSESLYRTVKYRPDYPRKPFRQRGRGLCLGVCIRELVQPPAPPQWQLPLNSSGAGIAPVSTNKHASGIHAAGNRIDTLLA